MRTDPELAGLRHRTDRGDASAADELVELASERGDLDELRRLVDRGNRTAAEQLTELTPTERCGPPAAGPAGLPPPASGTTFGAMATMLERLRDATNSHDPERLAALFAEDYRSAQPLHPSRAFGGRAQVLANWSSVFEGVPDFTSELVASAVDGDTEWGEWDWRGRHPDGAPFAMRGVTILVVRDGLIAEARLYMEPVEPDGGDIDTAVQELYQPPAPSDEEGQAP